MTGSPVGSGGRNEDVTALSAVGDAGHDVDIGDIITISAKLNSVRTHAGKEVMADDDPIP